MKADQERVKTLLTDTVTLLCKNGLFFKNHLRIQGLLGITVDDDEVFIVHIDEKFPFISATEIASPHHASDLNCITANDHGSNAEMKDVLEKAVHTNLANSPPLKRRRKDWSPASSPVRVCQKDTIISSILQESQSNCCPSGRQVELPCLETDSGKDPSKEDLNWIHEEGSFSISVKEEKDDDCTIIENNSFTPDQKKFAIPESSEKHESELLQQLFNQFIPGNSDDLDKLMTEASVFQSQTTSDSLLQNITKPYSLPNADTSITDVLSVSYSSVSRQKISHQGQATGETVNSSSINDQPDASDVYLLPNLWLPMRRSMTSARRKRYECTLDSCGRQYQNTFDLYRHQRQKHHVPPEFYQQGKKQTFGIREIDPS